MANSIYSGLTAGIEIGGSKVQFLTGFELSVSQETFEAVTLGSAWKKKFPGIKTWEGSCEGLFTLDATQKLMFDALASDAVSAEVELTFIIGADKCLKGTALVSEAKITVKADDKTEISFSFEGSSSLVEFVKPAQQDLRY